MITYISNGPSLDNGLRELHSPNGRMIMFEYALTWGDGHVQAVWIIYTQEKL